MKLIVGLGNPGLRYRNTRHNAGFMAVTSLAKKHGIRISKKLFKGLAGEGRINKVESLLLLPQTYMNLSGESAASAAGRISGLSDLLVVYDDADLNVGSLRFRQKGSSGGHKGLNSIITSLGAEEFARLRIGIRPEEKPADTTEFVLRPFLKDEKPLLLKSLEEAVSGMEIWVTSGIEACMTAFNRKQDPF